MIYKIIAILILLVLSAFFSMSETALISLSRIRLRSLLEKKVKGAETIKRLKNDQHRLLSTILIGNNVVNISAASIATSIALTITPNHAIAISTGIVTLIILIFGEIMPKSLAVHHSEAISLKVATPLLFISYMLYPITRLLEKFTGVFIKPAKNPGITEDDLRSCVKLGEEAGFIKDIEKELIKNIFKFDEINVSKVMTPRTDIFAIEVNTTLRKVLPAIIKANYTRIPVYDGNLNNIVGMINMKSLIPFIKKNKLDIPIKKVMYDPFFVPEAKKVDSMLNQFRKRKEHMAIVVDEHGIVTGLVTLENVIEEIVGEIKDETDRVNPHIIKIGKKSWIVNGESDIEEVNEKIQSDFKESNDYSTISGMVLSKLGKIPEEGEKINFGNYIIEINDVEANRIVKVIVYKK